MAPGGAVAKITGKEGLEFTGKARTFDTEDAFVEAVEKGEIKKGEKTVAVLRYLGPKGGPGESGSHDFSFSILRLLLAWELGLEVRGSWERTIQTCLSSSYPSATPSLAWSPPRYDDPSFCSRCLVFHCSRWIGRLHLYRVIFLIWRTEMDTV